MSRKALTHVVEGRLAACRGALMSTVHPVAAVRSTAAIGIAPSQIKWLTLGREADVCRLPQTRLNQHFASYLPSLLGTIA